MINIETTNVFNKNITALSNGARYVINQGGTRSGKSYSSVQIAVIKALTNTFIRVVVSSVTLDISKSTAVRDLKKVLGRYFNSLGKFDKQANTYFFKNKSEIKFISAENPDKYHGLDSDYVILDEPNIYKDPDELIKQLAQRCSGFLILNLNPSRRLDWLKKLEARKDVVLVHSTYLDNSFLSSRIVAEINERSKTDEVYRSIYKLGKYVANTQLSIFKNWSIIDNMPDVNDCKWITYGLDFGWNPDPTALVEVRYYNGALYVKEHLYEQNLSTAQISKALQGIEYSIYADRSEPRLITELKNIAKEKGEKLQLKKARKPAGSILAGLKILQSLPIYIHSKSVNLKEEFELYTLKKVNGQVTNKPIDKHNHLIDALRYGVSTKFKF